MPYQRWCRECHRAYSRTYRLAHLEECRAATRRWYANLPSDLKKVVRQRSRENYLRRMADPEKAEAFRKHAAEYYQQHKAERDAYNKRYRQEHKRKKLKEK